MEDIKEYVFIIKEKTELYNFYDGEFITEDEEEARRFFEENWQDIEQYFTKIWKNIDGDWIEDEVEILYE